MNVISDIAQHIQTATGVTTYYSKVPAAMNTGIVVLDTGGPTPNPDLPLKERTFQIFFRSTDYDTGQAQLEQVYTLLHRTQNTTIGSSFFYNILALSMGGHLGKSESGQDEFSLNFQYLTR
jgi:hypothetical protein